MTKSFDDTVSKHKNNLIESLSQFNEGNRVRGLLMDIESNKSDYEYYFNAGQQSKQAEVDELQKRIDLALDVIYKEKSAVECDKYIGVDADLIIGIGYDLHKILKGDSHES